MRAGDESAEFSSRFPVPTDRSWRGDGEPLDLLCAAARTGDFGLLAGYIVFVPETTLLLERLKDLLKY